MDNNKEKIWEEQDERIERFLKNQMDEQEEKMFKDNLKSDSNLAERAKAMAVLIRSMKQIGEEHDKKIIESVRHPRGAKSRLIPMYAKVIALAASVLLLVGISDFFVARNRTMNVAEHFMTYAPKMDIEEGAVKGTAADKAVLQELMQLADKVEEGVMVTEVIPVLADRFEQAISAEVNVYTDYADYIGYNLAIAYLKDNDRSAAKTVLKRVLEVYPDFEAADKLLKEIENIKGLW